MIAEARTDLDWLPPARPLSPPCRPWHQREGGRGRGGESETEREREREGERERGRERGS